MYVALLAVLKAGAAFIPIDPAAPADRVGYIAQDSDLDLVLTTSALAGSCADLRTSVLHLDAQTVALAMARPHRPDIPATRDPTCYILYTSGSSGRPKGVDVPQSSICNFITVVPELYGVRPTERVYQGMTISFDFSIEEIWPTWAMGATLVAGPTDGRRVGTGLADFLEQSRITMIYCVPTVLATLDRTIDSITTVNVGGEAWLGLRLCAPLLLQMPRDRTVSAVRSQAARLGAGRASRHRKRSCPGRLRRVGDADAKLDEARHIGGYAQFSVRLTGGTDAVHDG
jgi:non-ribosomal peptide synthetase component F